MLFIEMKEPRVIYTFTKHGCLHGNHFAVQGPTKAMRYDQVGLKLWMTSTVPLSFSYVCLNQRPESLALVHSVKLLRTHICFSPNYSKKTFFLFNFSTPWFPMFVSAMKLFVGLHEQPQFIQFRSQAV